MQEENSENRCKLMQGIAKIRQALGRLMPDKQIKLKDVTLNYVSLRAINEALAPLLEANKINILVSGTEVKDDFLYIKLNIHSTEFAEEIVLSYAIAIDNSDRRNTTQNFGSTLTYGIRYALRSLFMIADDDDMDSAVGTSIKTSEEKLKEMEDTATTIVDWHKLRNEDAEALKKALLVYRGHCLGKISQKRVYELLEIEKGII